MKFSTITCSLILITSLLPITSATAGIASSQSNVMNVSHHVTWSPAHATSRVYVNCNLDAMKATNVEKFNPENVVTYDARMDSLIYDAKGKSHAVNVYVTKRTPLRWEMNVMVEDVIVGSGMVNFTYTGELSNFDGLRNITWYPVGSKPVTFSLVLDGTTEYAEPFQCRAIHSDGNAPGLLV